MRHPPKTITIGQRFGKLIVLEKIKDRVYGVSFWRCLCDCGNEAIMNTARLNSGKVKNCGLCESFDAESLDLSGQRFGKLVVLNSTEATQRGYRMWRCRCDCGNYVLVNSNGLLNRITESCGCQENDGEQTLDLTGQRFGRLVVIEPTSENQDGTFLWKCRCDCGSVISFISDKLHSGLATSCGCDRQQESIPDANYKCQRIGRLTVKDKVGEDQWVCTCLCGKTKNLTAAQIGQGFITDCGCTLASRTPDLRGQRFGKLVVIGISTERRDTQVLWNCVCDCGNTTLVRTSHLKKGAIKSCGCSHHDNQDISGQRRGHLTALRRTGKNDQFGKSIYEWRCDCGRIIELTSRGTASSTRNPMCPDCLRKFKQGQASDMRERIEVDPDTGVALKALNNIIEGKLTAANNSGMRGVCWHRSRKKWIAIGRENGKAKQIGVFDSMAEAIKAREAHVRRVYGGPVKNDPRTDDQ